MMNYYPAELNYPYLTQIKVSPFATLFSVLSLVFIWKIYEDRGEKGYKALIPFYRHKVFGRIAKEETLGNEVMKKEILLIILLILSLIIFPVMSDPYLMFAILVFLCLFAIWILILYIKLIYKFVVNEKAETYWTVIWLFITPLATLYFAFLKNNKKVGAVVNKVKDKLDIKEIDDEEIIIIEEDENGEELHQ